MASDDKKSKKSIEFFDCWAQSYDSFVFRGFLYWAQHKVAQELGFMHQENLLDVGCGTGRLIETVLNNTLVASVYGVDVSREMLRQSRDRVGKTKKVTLLKVAVEELTEFLPKEHFHNVACNTAFHHFCDPLVALIEMRKVLKPGGKLIISDMDFPPLLFMNILWKLEPGFVKMYNKDEWKEMLEAAGLKFVSHDRIGFLWAKIVAEK